MSENFKKVQIGRTSKPNIRIILSDIMDCYVPIVRLSESEIEKATNVNNNNHNRCYSDHKYSLPVRWRMNFT